MTTETLLYVLGWSGVINVALIVFWFFLIIFAGDFVYRMHGKLFKVSEQEVAKIHYAGLLNYKMIIVFFNIVPYLAIRIVT